MNLFLADERSQNTNVLNKCSALDNCLFIVPALAQVLFPVCNGPIFSNLQTLPDISTNSNSTFFVKSSLASSLNQTSPFSEYFLYLLSFACIAASNIVLIKY